MENTFQGWYDREKEWIKRIAKDRKKTFARYAIAVLIVVPVQFALPAFFSNTTNVRFAMRSFVLGIPMGILFAALVLWRMNSASPARQYIKNINKQLAGFSETEKEAFALQMLGEENPDSVRKFIYMDKSRIKHRITVTKDYAMKVQSTGRAVLVKFADVERMVSDAEEDTVFLRANRWMESDDSMAYPLCFYYYAGKERGKQPDKMFVFEDYGLRNEVADCIREISHHKMEAWVLK